MRLRSAFAAIAHACRGASALTWTAWFITLPLSVAVALTPEGVESTRSPWAGALAAIVAHIVLIPVFVTALWVLRHRRPLVVVLLIYAAIGALRGLVVVTIEQAIAPSDGTSLIGRVTVSAALAVVGFTTIAVVIDRVRTYRDGRRRLHEALRRVHAMGSIPEQLADVESALHELARHSAINADQLAARLQSLIEDGVRPMSHRLLADPECTAESTDRQSRLKRLRVSPPNPWLVALALEGGAFLPVTRQVGAATAVVNVVIASLVIVGLGLSLNSALRRLGESPRWLILGSIAVGYAAVGAVAMGVSDITFRLFGSIVPLYFMAIPFAAIWAIFVSLATGADQEAQETEDALARLLREEVIDATVSRVNARALARCMHGHVQGELAAIMMALRHPSSPVSVEAAQARLLALSESLMATLAASESMDSTTTGDEIDSFFNVWSQALDVQWIIDADCRERLRAQPEGWSGVRAVIMEGLTNVVRHAAAAHAIVSIVADEGRYGVDIVSPGTLRITDLGMGLQGLSESFGIVEIQQRSGQVHLRVRVTPEQFRATPINT